MRRRALWLIVLMVLLAGTRSTPATDTMQIDVRLRANSAEAEEGYFQAGEDLMLIARPGTPAHQWLINHVGQELTVSVEPRYGTADELVRR